MLIVKLIVTIFPPISYTTFEREKKSDLVVIRTPVRANSDCVEFCISMVFELQLLVWC